MSGGDYGRGPREPAGAIGEADPLRGETPVAYVEPGEGVTLDVQALRDWCRTRLAAYKIPRRIVIEPKLPRGPTGKVLKRALAGGKETE